MCCEDRYDEKQGMMHVIIAELLPHELRRADAVRNLVVLVCEPLSLRSRASRWSGNGLMNWD